MQASLKRKHRQVRLRLQRHWRAVAGRLDQWLPAASLQTYLVAMILLATLPIALLLTWQVAGEARSGRQSAVALLQQSAASVAQAAEQDLQASLDALTALSLMDALQQGDLPAFGQYLRQTPLRRPQWRSVFLTDGVGRMLLDTSSPTQAPLPRQEETRTLVFKVLARGRPAVSDVAWLGVEGTQVVVVGVPVYQDGVVRHVLGARMTTATWLRLLDALEAPGQGFIALFDGEQRVLALKEQADASGALADTPASVQLAGLMAAQLQSADSAAGVAGLMDAEPLLAAWRQVAGTGWKAGVGMASAPIGAAEHAIVFSALATMGLSLLLGVTVALLLGWRLAEPLRRLATGSALSPGQPLPVLEMAQLRQALLQAQQRDDASRQLLQRKAVEFETLFNHSPIGLAFAEDCTGARVLYNPAMRQLMGEDAPGRGSGVEIMYRGRVLEPGEQPLVRACRRAETVQGMEMEVRVPGRAAAFVVANAVPLPDHHGRARGALCATMDITEIRQVVALWLAADAGQQARQRLIDLAQEAGHVGFFEYRYRSDAMVCTPGLRLLLGVPDSVPLAHLQHLLALLEPADQGLVRQSLVAAVVGGAERIHFDCRVHAGSQGPVRWLACRVLVHYASDGRPEHMTGTVVDATEQKEAQLRGQRQTEEEQAARHQAEAANRAKDEFLTMLSHELRNPLGAITAALEVVQSGAGGQAGAQRALAVMVRQTQHLAHMVGDLLDAGRVVTGKVRLVQAPLDLAQVVQDARHALALRGQLEKHTWEFCLEPAPVYGDAVRLEQVVTSLLSNAFQYSPAGTHIRVQVRPLANMQDGMDTGADTRENAGTAEEGADAAQGAHAKGSASHCAKAGALLQVSDQGIGMAPELLARVFDLFVQGERPLHRRGGGLGVGLTLVHRLVALHGGTVQVASAPGQGSVFTLCLPAPAPAPLPPLPPPLSPLPLLGSTSEAAGADGPAPAQAGPGAGLAGSHPGASARCKALALTLVLMEDNDDVRQSLQATLELDGHQVVPAADGRQGLELLLARRPDAALVDIGLPELDGLEVAHRARAAGYTGRLVALSGYGQPHSRSDALQAGFDAFLVKPVQTAHWRAVLAGEGPA